MQKDESIKARKTNIKDRNDQATSSKTLEDLEADEKISSGAKTSDLPSPDGALDGENELDEAGPM